MNHSEELGLATALASTTDKGRAEILANMEDEPKKAPQKPKTAPSKGENPVEDEMALQEDQSVLGQAWGKVRDAVSAAESACRKAHEAEPDAKPNDPFKEHLGHLIDVLTEMSDSDDVFKKMAKDAATLKP